jgi:hypothetical protein
MLPAAIRATAEMAIDDIEAGVKGLFKVGQFAPRASRTNDREARLSYELRQALGRVPNRGWPGGRVNQEALGAGCTIHTIDVVAQQT